VKLPRDLSGTALATLLRRHGYEVTRQTGSHLRLTCNVRGHEHHVTVPRHREVKVGTLGSIIAEVAGYLEMDRETLSRELFGR
jgi:predicted RNA binding protein YcfA (HicA-like mRNA interferase family)